MSYSKESTNGCEIDDIIDETNDDIENIDDILSNIDANIIVLDKKADKAIKDFERKTKERNKSRIISFAIKFAIALVILAALGGGMYYTNVIAPDINGVAYALDGDSYYVEGKSQFSRRITIQAEVSGRPVISIADNAFEECSTEHVTIENGVTSIGKCAFKNCTKLRTIVIPSTVTEIGEQAFFGCSSLYEITFEGSREQWEKISQGAFDSEINVKFTVADSD